MSLKVLLNDGLAEEGIAIFRKRGFEVDCEKKPQQYLHEVIGDYDALVVRSATKVTEPVINSGFKGNLKIVGRAGVGYDNIDVKTATEKGIVVKYAPHGNSNAAAELALALMLDVSRNVPQAHSSLKDRVWKKKQFKGCEVSKKTLGIIGCGRIGQRLADLVRGFDMEVIGYDPFPKPDSRIKYKDSVDDVLREADYVSIHTPGTEQVVGKGQIGLMKQSAYLINVSRGGSVDERALYDALSERRIAGAGLDVYSTEPKEDETFESPFALLENVVLTSHLGASTVEAQKKTAIEIADVVSSYILCGNHVNAVNIKETAPAEQPVYAIHIFHEDVPGAFANIDGIFGANGINIRQPESRRIGENVTSVYLVHDIVPDSVLQEIGRLDVVYRVRAVRQAFEKSK